MEQIINHFMSLVMFITNVFSFPHGIVNNANTDNIVYQSLLRFWGENHENNPFYCFSPASIVNPMVVVSIFLFFLFLFLLARHFILAYYYKRKKNWIKWCAASVFVSGYILYFIGFYYEGSSGSFFAMLLRPLMSSLEMFASHSDLLEVDRQCKDDPVYMTWFSITHFLAVLISLYVVLNWAFQRFNQKFHFSRLWEKSKTTDNLYIFFDTNDAAWTLAKDIFKKHNSGTHNHKKFNIIFIDEPEEIEDGQKGRSLIDIFNIRAFRKQTRERIASKEIKSALFVCSDKNVSSEFPTTKTNLWKEANLENVADLIKQSRHTHVFLFSEDEQDNIAATWNLQQDPILNQKKHTIYCKARDNYANRAAVNKYLRSDVNLIDDSALSIDVLKKWKKGVGFHETYPAHPINYVEIDNKSGFVKSKFTALIIGCGRTGRDAMRFIYEFGAFVGPDNEKSPFVCYLVDKNMKSIKGGMERNIPALPSLENEIIFWDLDVNSTSFRLKLGSIINNLNYVVIAAGDDEQNMHMAIDVYEFAMRYRKKGLDRFSIFVRSYNKSDERKMNAIEQFYFMADKNEIIKVFGKKDEIYTYNNIINDEDEKDFADTYFMAYQQISHDLKYNSWEERHNEISNLENDYAKRLELEQKEKQDFSNVLHMYTKVKLCDYLCNKTLEMDAYPFDDINNSQMNDYIQCMRVLSKLEHLRWNAAHFMAGFLYDVEKDFRKKTHKCIKPFEKLGNDQKYDYAVVKTTIDLYQQRNNVIVEEKES